MSTHLGFVGAGFVGGAMIRAFSGYFPMTVYDLGKGIGSLDDIVDKSDVIFVAVPTPMRKDGSCDTRIIEEVLLEIDGKLTQKTEVVVRSTCPPQFFLQIHEKLNRTTLVFMPEFLTERTADLDFINAPRYIFGVYHPNLPLKVADVFEERFPRTRQTKMTWEEASLVKYGTNVFFTIKIAFFNELYKLAEGMDANPEEVIAEILQDGRIGRSHFQVPGHDGDFGFGGHCFPKDSQAFCAFADGWHHMAMAAWDVNQQVRKNYDWEEQKGRAVSED
jgi:UDPglucose 6-dehydrogenase